MLASGPLAGETPSAAPIAKWLRALSSERWQFRSSTGRRSASYVSSNAGDAWPFSTAASFQHRFCASWIALGQPQPAGGRMPVGGVAQQEHPPDPERRRDDRVHRPACDLADPHRQSTDPQCLADIGLDLLVGLGARIVDRIVEMHHPLLRVRPPPLGAHRDHDDERAHLRGEDPADQHVLIGCVGGEVGGDVQCRRLGDDAEAFVLHPDQPGDPAAAVGADHVAAAYDVLAAGRAVTDHRHHPIFVLVELDQLVTEPDAAGRQLLGPRLHQRLQPDLREIELPPRARRRPVLVGAAGAPGLEPVQAAAVVGIGAGEPGVVRGCRHLGGRCAPRRRSRRRRRRRRGPPSPAGSTRAPSADRRSSVARSPRDGRRRRSPAASTPSIPRPRHRRPTPALLRPPAFPLASSLRLLEQVLE